METVFDPIRREWVAALPEECVRQALLHKMIGLLGYPSSLIVVEKSLKEMPHLSLSRRRMPLRRADIVCFGKGIHPTYSLYPLLVIECKAVKIDDKVLRQVQGYNHYMQAYFIAVANAEEMRVGWRDRSTGQYHYLPTLPSYQELLQALR